MKKNEWIIEGILKKGGLSILNVSHDNWCNSMKDKSKECNCNPDLDNNIIDI